MQEEWYKNHLFGISEAWSGKDAMLDDPLYIFFFSPMFIAFWVMRSNKELSVQSRKEQFRVRFMLYYVIISQDLT